MNDLSDELICTYLNYVSGINPKHLKRSDLNTPFILFSIYDLVCTCKRFNFLREIKYLY